MQANDLPVVAQAVSPASHILSQFPRERSTDESATYPTLLLAVGCRGTVLAEVVFVPQRFGDWPGGGVDGDGLPSHGGDLFHDGRQVRGLGHRLTPAERGVAGDQAGGAAERVDAFQTGDDRSEEHTSELQSLRHI